MSVPAALLPLLKAGFVEPDIKVGDTVAPRADTSIELSVVQLHRLGLSAGPHDAVICLSDIEPRRGHRFSRAGLILLEPRWPGDRVQAWITERLIKRRGRR